MTDVGKSDEFLFLTLDSRAWHGGACGAERIPNPGLLYRERPRRQFASPTNPGESTARAFPRIRACPELMSRKAEAPRIFTANGKGVTARARGDAAQSYRGGIIALLSWQRGTRAAVASAEPGHALRRGVSFADEEEGAGPLRPDSDGLVRDLFATDARAPGAGAAWRRLLCGARRRTSGCRPIRARGSGSVGTLTNRLTVVLFTAAVTLDSSRRCTVACSRSKIKRVERCKELVPVYAAATGTVRLGVTVVPSPID